MSRQKQEQILLLISTALLIVDLALAWLAISITINN